MKKILSIALVLVMCVSLFAGLGTTALADDNVINLYAFTDEVPTMLQKYIDEHPDFGYTLNTTIIATTDGAYQPALDQALAAVVQKCRRKQMFFWTPAPGLFRETPRGRCQLDFGGVCAFPKAVFCLSDGFQKRQRPGA